MIDLQYITLHWTAGRGYPSESEKEHYHFLVDIDGNVYAGKYKPEDNLNTSDKRYAAHCHLFNTGNIGYAMCGMAGFKSKYHIGDFPLTKIQCERMFMLMAKNSVPALTAGIRN